MSAQPASAPGAQAAPTTSPPVPFVDLRRVHEPLKQQILADVAELIDSSAFSGGAAVREFEASFASFCGRSDAVGVASGLDALRLGLIAAGVGAGDEVVVPADTFIATLEAVTQVGATPVLADVTWSDYNLDPAAAEAAVTPRTRALLPVHLYGQLADMESISALASRHELVVIEDACQAHGASRAGYRPGQAAAAAAFSFYPGKNLGAMGDAGALVTDDPELAAAVRRLREHGQREKYRHEVPGFTSRLDSVQALILSRKLERLDRWNAERARAAAFYAGALAGVGDLVLPPVAAGSRPVWHLYVVRTERPESLARFLAERGVATGRHYPVPPHLSGAYASLGHRRGAFPVTEEIADHGLSLPIFPGILDAELAAVADAVTAYFADARHARE